jgi:hypothetical protein
MKTFVYIMMILVLVVSATGCGGDKERGINRPNQKKDLPRAVPTENTK